jgi:DeoR/GlpR family transcriptional regulator of sugar metabolism
MDCDLDTLVGGLLPSLGHRGCTVDRRRHILGELQANEEITVTECAEQFDVSEATIRRDLAHLEEVGLLERTHGGAKALSSTPELAPFDARLLRRPRAKCLIGRAAAELVGPGDTILLDSGTTVLEVARSLPPTLLETGDLTVVTRSLVIASQFRIHRSVRLVILGGLYIQEFDTLVGPPVEDALRDLHADTLFVGTDGVTTDRGLSTDNVLEASLFTLMAQSCDRVVAVVDSSKVGVHKLQTILPFESIHTFITDTEAPGDFVQFLEGRGIETITVAVSDQAEDFQIGQ